jgi:hypothetical protein
MDDEPGVAPPVLISGEIGTGKGVVARELHAASRRASRAFVEVECAAMSPSRLERELFGYEGGVVDAPGAVAGLFEAADGGMLFLDDVDALSLDLQGKVLAVLENGAVRRLGGVEARSVDVRIIVATHVDLDTAARRGTFRADLLGRFARSTLTLVPLRERPEDILPLARQITRWLLAHGAARRRAPPAIRIVVVGTFSEMAHGDDSSSRRPARRVGILAGADRGAPGRWSQPDGVLRAAWAAQGHVQFLQVEARRRHRSRPQGGDRDAVGRGICLRADPDHGPGGPGRHGVGSAGGEVELTLGCDRGVCAAARGSRVVRPGASRTRGAGAP